MRTLKKNSIFQKLARFVPAEPATRAGVIARPVPPLAAAHEAEARPLHVAAAASQDGVAAPDAPQLAELSARVDQKEAVAKTAASRADDLTRVPGTEVT